MKDVGKYTKCLTEKKEHEFISKLGKAISSKTRLEIYSLIFNQPKTCYELAKILNMNTNDVIFHLKVLEEGKLIKPIYKQSKKDQKKLWCVSLTSCQLVDAIWDGEKIENYFEEIPIGMYVDAEYLEYIVIRTKEDRYYLSPDERFSPLRKDAVLLWNKGAKISYSFSRNFQKNKKKIAFITFSFEACSEVPAYNNKYRCEIPVACNGYKLGSFVSLGDYGDKRGLNNPPSWSNNVTQYGDLVIINITDEGTFINHQKTSDVTIEDILSAHNFDIRLDIGEIEEGIEYRGYNLFGKDFGNIKQDIQMQVQFEKEQ